MMQILQAIQARVATRHDETGATAVEYGMIVALIAAVIVTIVATLGGQINDAFTAISDAL
jgi:pilus assembly protein Flp/PilA